LAALWKVPLVAVVEDNGWGISVSEKNSTSIPSNDLRAPAYGIKGYHLKDNDPLELYRVSKEAVKTAKTGGVIATAK